MTLKALNNTQNTINEILSITEQYREQVALSSQNNLREIKIALMIRNTKQSMKW